ncbi:hypothetical protein [Cytobacillus firmus]|uniref:hypothetical protein n=1 Tax=Cytobacillus firmus TaxID=1399 RepID=UPI0018CD507E|nr:hypothetical protein [Cytobacillus firmus]MBG9550027.1 hypothetical protein [Cytobacillus firmus]MBG9605012.1 hypothetical protein [Cytobacillus firmus]MED1940814.1 hypothetical protein [Cytobacillus firmus]
MQTKRLVTYVFNYKGFTREVDLYRNPIDGKVHVGDPFAKNLGELSLIDPGDVVNETQIAPVVHEVSHPLNGDETADISVWFLLPHIGEAVEGRYVNGMAGGEDFWVHFPKVSY